MGVMMKSQFLLAVAAIGLAACGPTPENQELENRFEEYDLNGNGCVTQGEYYEAGGSQLMYGIYSGAIKGKDANGDGQICQDEL